MNKTKLGISENIMGGLCFILALVGGYVSLILFAGYVLLMEKSVLLKKYALSALAMLISFSLITCVVGVLPEMVNFVDSFVALFNGSCSAPIVDTIYYLVLYAVEIIKVIVFVLFATMAFKGKAVTVPFISKLVDKHFEEVEIEE